MRCRFFNEISDEWVEEKCNCPNPNAIERTRSIENLLRLKFEEGPQYFTPQEFTEFLWFKGAARRIRSFLETYNNTGEVEEVTHNLFTTRLTELTFENTQDAALRNEILNVINTLFYHLQQLKYVGPGVASACVALCFPEFCGTADYIVPALLHNEHDHLNQMNPFFANQYTRQRLQEALITPVFHSLSASRARSIATHNYTTYVQELWSVKTLFRLTHQVRKIEEAIWSFGICYIRKSRDNKNKPVDNKPLIFNPRPNPPKGGTFSKYCTNQPRHIF